MVAKSPPTIARTPASPTSRPSTPVRPRRSVPPVATANTVPISGVLAMRSPVSELERRCSAEPRRTHGIAISIAANAATQRQWTSTARRSIRRSATGSRIAVAISVRRNTSTGGEISATATRMNRYGMPQMIAIESEQDQPAPRHRGTLARRIDPSFHACAVVANARSAGRAVTGQNTPAPRPVARWADGRDRGDRPAGSGVGASVPEGRRDLSGWSRAATPAPR